MVFFDFIYNVFSYTYGHPPSSPSPPTILWRRSVWRRSEVRSCGACGGLTRRDLTHMSEILRPINSIVNIFDVIFAPSCDGHAIKPVESASWKPGKVTGNLCRDRPSGYNVPGGFDDGKGTSRDA